MSDSVMAPGAPDSAASPHPFAGTRAEGAPRQQFTSAIIGRLGLGAVVIAGVLVGVGFVVKGSSDALTHADGVASRWFAIHRIDALDGVTLFASDMAKTATVIGLAVVVMVALRLWLRRWYESVVLAIALMGEVLIFLTVVTIVHRPRPPVFRLDPAPPTSSFPSGHTAAAITVYGFVAFVLWRYMANRYVATAACVLLFAVPIAVGLSRLYRGAHFPTDVLGGMVLGVVWLVFVIRTLMPGKPEGAAA